MILVLGYNPTSTSHRGVAQLIARAVWDREVEGLSPFTPTIELMLLQYISTAIFYV
jgi:hypothetical protein